MEREVGVWLHFKSKFNFEKEMNLYRALESDTSKWLPVLITVNSLKLIKF